MFGSPPLSGFQLIGPKSSSLRLVPYEMSRIREHSRFIYSPRFDELVHLNDCWYLRGTQGRRRRSISRGAFVLASCFWLSIPNALLSYLDSSLLSLDLSVANLAVVDDHRVPAGAARGIVSPANALGELGIGVGEEELE